MLAWYKILYYLCNREREDQVSHPSKLMKQTFKAMKKNQTNNSTNWKNEVNEIRARLEAVKTRKEAARELWAIYCAYEVRPVKLATIYRRIWFDGSNWRLIGYAHDYTA